MDAPTIQKKWFQKPGEDTEMTTDNRKAARDALINYDNLIEAFEAHRDEGAIEQVLDAVSSIYHESKDYIRTALAEPVAPAVDVGMLEDLRAAPATGGDGWMSIETAPMPRKSNAEPEWVLLWDGITQKTGYWCDTTEKREEFVRETKSGNRIYEWIEDVSGYWEVDDSFSNPTHWRPLPEPPHPAAAQDGGE